jgi:hypothetical protein
MEAIILGAWVTWMTRNDVIFKHIRADLYRRRSIFKTELRWLKFKAVRKYSPSTLVDWFIWSLFLFFSHLYLYNYLVQMYFIPEINKFKKIIKFYSRLVLFPLKKRGTWLPSTWKHIEIEVEDVECRSDARGSHPYDYEARIPVGPAHPDAGCSSLVSGKSYSSPVSDAYKSSSAWFQLWTWPIYSSHSFSSS